MRGRKEKSLRPGDCDDRALRSLVFFPAWYDFAFIILLSHSLVGWEGCVDVILGQILYKRLVSRG